MQMRVNAAKHVVLPGHVAHDKRDRFVLAIVVEDLVKYAEFGGKISFGKSDIHTARL